LDTESSDTDDLTGLREQVTAIDREIVDAINRRIGVVTRIWERKSARGLGKVDPERERWLQEHLAEANLGPLSPEGLREIHAAILELTKREVERGRAGSPGRRG
jgi:chorismate mutase